MIKSKRTLFLGIFIFIIPFLGFPSAWKTAFVMLSGLALVALSVKITVPKRGVKKPRRKEKVTPVFVENAPIIHETEPTSPSVQKPEDTE